MIQAVYQYNSVVRAVNYVFPTLISKHDVITRYRMWDNRLDFRSFESVHKFKTNSSSSRTNFILEFIYE